MPVALAIETDQATTESNPRTAEQSNNPDPAETDSTLEVNAESFLHDFSPDGALENGRFSRFCFGDDLKEDDDK